VSVSPQTKTLMIHGRGSCYGARAEETRTT